MKSSVELPKFSKGFTIAIDGPVGSGKGTVASELARRVHAVTFYTGAMYRALALKCIKESIDLEDNNKVKEILNGTKIELKGKKKGDFSEVFLDEKDVTSEIVRPEFARGASIVGQIAEVRKFMVNIQREMVMHQKEKGKIVVMEGRDIGTRVLPDADLKIYLTADLLIRAKRHLKRYTDRKINMILEQAIHETEQRDLQDTNREVDPLVSDPEKYGYCVLDNSTQTINETIDIIIRMIKEKYNCG